jgi:hypothetical protein
MVLLRAFAGLIQLEAIQNAFCIASTTFDYTANQQEINSHEVANQARFRWDDSEITVPGWDSRCGHLVHRYTTDRSSVRWNACSSVSVGN